MIREAIKIFTDAAENTVIGFNGLYALKIEQSQIEMIQLVKSIYFCRYHGILFFIEGARD